MKIFCVIWDIKDEKYYTLESPWTDQELEDIHFYVIDRFDTLEEAIQERLRLIEYKSCDYENLMNINNCIDYNLCKENA